MAEPTTQPTVEFDPETASLDDLRAAVYAKPEDDDDPTPPAAAAAVVPAVDPPTNAVSNFRREIDLGDGGGVQVFEADSLEGLVDKLATAQTNATRKIREMSAAQKADPAPAEPTFSNDEEWVIGQEMLTKPSEAFGKLFERFVGKPITAFKSDMARLEAFERGQSEYSASQEFIQKQPDYTPTPANGERMAKYMELYKLPVTVENLEKVFADLSKSGLLEAKPPSNATDGQPTTTEQRIAPSADDQPPTRRAASGLSARRNAPVTVSPEPTEEELANMPMEKLRELATKSLYSNGQ